MFVLGILFALSYGDLQNWKMGYIHIRDNFCFMVSMSWAQIISFTWMTVRVMIILIYVLAGILSRTQAIWLSLYLTLQ